MRADRVLTYSLSLCGSLLFMVLMLLALKWIFGATFTQAAITYLLVWVLLFDRRVIAGYMDRREKERSDG